MKSNLSTTTIAKAAKYLEKKKKMSFSQFDKNTPNVALDYITQYELCQEKPQDFWNQVDAIKLPKHVKVDRSE
jgi:hypothetical protein